MYVCTPLVLTVVFLLQNFRRLISSESGGSESCASPSGEPIKKSAREFIIPIAVEGKGYVTPRQGSLEPETSTRHIRTAKPRRIRSLLNIFCFTFRARYSGSKIIHILTKSVHLYDVTSDLARNLSLVSIFCGNILNSAQYVASSRNL